jgi:pSer/pThr/pTyr-binding forkhead associated (FHA) protein
MSQPPRFTWKTTDGATHEFEMTASEISIGRAPTCDIVLNDDQMVSRRHAIIRRQGNVVTAVDLGSSNGTLVNGSEIHDSTQLKDGDRVTIGDHDLMFTAAQEGAGALSAAPGAPVVETIRIGGSSTPISASSTMPPAPAYSAPSYSPSSPQANDPYMMPATGPVPPSPISAPMPPVPVAASGFDAMVEQDTGALGLAAGQAQSSYVHYVNGQEVEREESSRNYQEQIMMGGERVASVPARQDASALLSQIQDLHAQLSSQVATADQAAEVVRAGVRTALADLEAALSVAQSSTQLAALSDLRQLADSVGQSLQMDQVASFARRASEIRDVLGAHQALLNALENVRREMQDAVNR